jgi:hypothetical protein
MRESNPIAHMKVVYPARSVLSVWLGTFESETQFDRCVDADISPALNLSVPISSVCEVTFEQSSIPVAQLLEGFSGWETFIDQCTQKATALGIRAANAALICYYLRCEDAPERWGEMHFLGSFQGTDVK